MKYRLGDNVDGFGMLATRAAVDACLGKMKSCGGVLTGASSFFNVGFVDVGAAPSFLAFAAGLEARVLAMVDSCIYRYIYTHMPLFSSEPESLPFRDQLMVVVWMSSRLSSR